MGDDATGVHIFTAAGNARYKSTYTISDVNSFVMLIFRDSTGADGEAHQIVNVALSPAGSEQPSVYLLAGDSIVPIDYDAPLSTPIAVEATVCDKTLIIKANDVTVLDITDDRITNVQSIFYTTEDMTMTQSAPVVTDDGCQETEPVTPPKKKMSLLWLWITLGVLAALSVPTYFGVRQLIKHGQKKRASRQ
jgi:hypothetical protein